MSGPAVTVVASGGLPVKQVTSGAPAMTFKASGGIAVTLSNTGTPFILEGYGGGEVTPAPVFSVQPGITPSSGNVGDTFTAVNGTSNNTTSTSYFWLLDGVVIGTGSTIAPSSAGSLVRRQIATGAGGSTVANSAAVTVAAAADVTAPTLSSPTGTQTGQTTATVGVTTNEANGTLYHFISASSTPPTGTALKAGTGAIVSGSQAIGSTGAKTASISGLTASTTYYAHWLHRDAAGNDSAIVSTAGFTTAAAAAAPVNTVAPAVTGTAQAGNLLTTTNGTWTNSPTSYTYQWQRDGVNISGETASTYLLAGADEGETIRCVVTATNAGGSTAANSNSTAAVAAASGLTSPDITVTSAAGDPPEVDVGLKSDHYAGYYLDIQRAANTSSDFTTLTLDINYQITTQDFFDGITALELSVEGYVAPSGDYSQRYRIRRDDGVASAWVVITGTVTSSIMVLAQTTGAAKHTSMDTATYSGLGGRVTANVGGNGPGVRAETAVTGKRQFEVTLEQIGSTGPVLNVGVTDVAVSLTSPVNPGGGSSNPAGATARLDMSSTNIARIFNGSAAATTSMGSIPQVGDKVVVRFDTATNTVQFWHYRGGVETLIYGPSVLTSKIPTDWVPYVAGYNTNDRFSITADAADFVKPLTDGYAGW